MFSGPEPRQRGFVLVFAMLALLLSGVLVTAVMRGSMTELRMAGNLETAALERQRALREIEHVLAHLGIEAPTGSRGYVHCRTEGAGCDSASLAAISAPPEVDSSHLRIVATDRPPPRTGEAHASSGLAYRAVHYEVVARAGHTSLAQGVAVLVAEPAP